MGTHRDSQPPRARFRQWRRRRQYKRILAALLAEEPKPITDRRRAQLDAAARRAAGYTGE